MATLEILILVGVFAVIGIIFYIAYLADKKRTQEMSHLSQVKGFSFNPKPSISSVQEISSFKLFSKGHAKKVRNLMQGSLKGISVKVFDYRYTVGGGKNSHTYHQTVFLRQSKKSLPNFYLGPENFFHKFGNIFGYNDIDFDQFPDFSKRYLLKGDNESSIKSLFNMDVIKYFEKLEKQPIIEAGNGQIVFYYSGKKTKPDNFDSFLEKASKALNMFDNSKF